MSRWAIRREPCDYGRGRKYWYICGPHPIYQRVPLFQAMRHPVIAYDYLHGRPVYGPDLGPIVGYEDWPDGSIRVIYRDSP